MQRIGACLLVALIALHVKVALADTACPTVSSETQILTPVITGAPEPIALASYDTTTLGLMVQFAGQGNKATYFYGVPNQLIIGRGFVPWSTIAGYPQAVTQEQSPCPVLAVTGKPLFSTGNAVTTYTPFVAAPCPLVTDGTELSVASIMFPPYTIYQAVYDAKTQFLTVQFVSGISSLFVGVPDSVATAQIQWNSLYPYFEALMVEHSACPVLTGGSPYQGWSFGVSAFGIGSF